MAQVISLKELRTSNVLKVDISKLEDDKLQLLEQLERQKQLEKMLRDELISHKKDFEHLEQQFEHFAGIEAEYEALQQRTQMDRLEQMIDGDRKDSIVKGQLKKSKDELKEAQDELRELKALDPQRLKRQPTDIKKKTLQQATDNQNVNNALVTVRKELKDITTEKEKLESDLKSSRNSTDFFWQSLEGAWTLYESTTILKDEKVDEPDKFKRIRCMFTATGMSALSKGRDDKDKAEWLGTMEIPEEVSIEAGKRLLSIVAELEEAAKDKTSAK